MHGQDARAAVRPIRESQNTQPPVLRFRAVMTEGSTQMNFYSEGFDHLDNVSA
jgi:hypothetical protein